MSNIDAYAFKRSGEVLKKSSSGGAFISVAEIIFHMATMRGKKCVCFGAAYDDNMKVAHTCAESIYECKKFHGSKYVKSNLGTSFSEVKNALEKGAFVLFSGTPCQIYGLKTFLKANQVRVDNLYTVDLICHGTPSVRFWDDYKKFLEHKYKSKLVAYSFRDKTGNHSASGYASYAKFKNGREIYDSLSLRVYVRLFLRGYLAEKGCYKCPFSSMNREGDITLGDFWGIEELMKTFPEKDGVSLVIVNSKKGAQIAEQLSGNMVFNDQTMKKCETQDYVKYQHNLNEPTEMPEDYAEFRNDYEKHGFEYVIKKYANYNCKSKIMDLLKRR